tara:strand:- start:390 stop:914 length:525 start_codon:yes stop_codon:yes gene_type:complete
MLECFDVPSLLCLNYYIFFLNIFKYSFISKKINFELNKKLLIIMEELRVDIENIDKTTVENENQDNSKTNSNTDTNSEYTEAEFEEKKNRIKELLKIKSKIDGLNKNEYYEIFKILENNNENFSSNKNGVMFDLLKLKQPTIDKINKLLKYFLEKNMQINNDEYNRDKYKEILN